MMEVIYLGNTGSRREWLCRHEEKTYYVSFHCSSKSWSVQLFREDGEHEILSAQEADGIMAVFPQAEALRLAESLDHEYAGELSGRGLITF